MGLQGRNAERGEARAMHGERAARISNHAGRDYFKKRGFLFRCWGWMISVSNRASTNKKTKRFTHKSERQQVRKHIHKIMESVEC